MRVFDSLKCYKLFILLMLANIPNIYIDLPRRTGVHIARPLQLQRRPIMLIRSGVDATSFNKLLSAGRGHAVGGAARTESAVRQHEFFHIYSPD